MGDIINDTDDESIVAAEKIDIYRCIEDIAKYPKKAEARIQQFRCLVDDLVRNDKPAILFREADQRRGETALHAAIRLFKFVSEVEKSVVEILIRNFPKLILQNRDNSEYAGQTPLHMAVCKGNIWLVNTLLQEMSKKENKHWRGVLLKRRASGGIFKNTVMMAELPLSIAALTFNKGMFDLLLDHGADLDGTNKYGDNVCHSLIRYAFLYPDKLESVLEICQYISEDPAPYDTGSKSIRNRKLRKKIWLMENEEYLNPLQLSAKLGQHQLFAFIMKLEAYCFDNSKDGLFDIKIYDVTEMDAISSMSTEERTGTDAKLRKSLIPDNISARRAFSKENEPYRKSILMTLLELEPTCAFQFIHHFPPLRRIIDQKWNAYRKYFYPAWIFYVLFMSFLTWYAVERSKQSQNSSTGYDVDAAPSFEHNIPARNFVTIYGFFSAAIVTFFIIQECVRVIRGRMPLTASSFTNPYSNGTFRVMFVLLGLCLIIDLLFAIWSKYYENYCLIVAMIIGWFNVIFFIRAIRPFSFFTVLIQKVLIGDMFRFFVILGIELLAFTTAMFMVVQGSETASTIDFSNFGTALYSMFKLMVGLGEIATLYETRHPSLAIIIFIAFIILTTLLMINALIAMMSGTCAELVTNTENISARDRHWKLQRLSVVLFIESILPNGFIAKIGKEQSIFRYNNKIHRRKKLKRFMLEIRSIQSEYDDNEDEAVSSSWGLKTALVNALKGKHVISQSERPQSGVSDKIKLWFQRKTERKSKRRKSRKQPAEVELETEEVWEEQLVPQYQMQQHAQQTPNQQQQQTVQQLRQLPIAANHFPMSQNYGPLPANYGNFDNNGFVQTPDVSDHVIPLHNHVVSNASRMSPRSNPRTPTQQRAEVLEIYHVTDCRNCSDYHLSPDL